MGNPCACLQIISCQYATPCPACLAASPLAYSGFQVAAMLEHHASRLLDCATLLLPDPGADLPPQVMHCTATACGSPANPPPPNCTVKQIARPACAIPDVCRFKLLLSPANSPCLQTEADRGVGDILAASCRHAERLSEISRCMVVVLEVSDTQPNRHPRGWQPVPLLIIHSVEGPAGTHHIMLVSIPHLPHAVGLPLCA